MKEACAEAQRGQRIVIGWALMRRLAIVGRILFVQIFVGIMLLGTAVRRVGVGVNDVLALAAAPDLQFKVTLRHRASPSRRASVSRTGRTTGRLPRRGSP